MSDSLAQAIDKFEAQARRLPDDYSALHDLSILYTQAGKIEQALDTAQRVTSIAPDLAEGWLNLGNLALRTGRTEIAINAFRTTTNVAPDDPRGWFNLGNVLASTRQRSEAIAALEKAHLLAPGNVGVMASLALAYRKHLRVEDAIALYSDALKHAPHDANIQSNLIVAHQYLPSSTDGHLHTIHKVWKTAQLAPSNNERPRITERDRPLRVGYVSGDFRQHPIGYFLLGVLRNHDSQHVHAVCFSDTHLKDSMTDALKRNASDWVETHNLNHDSLFETIREYDIDVLVDLSGHFARNRLPVFSRRAAPVQATWAGYVGTTGLAEMDWLIADKHHAPKGYEQWASENIARLPSNYVCYTPPENAPQIGALPSLQSGIVTFGCFNNLVKMNQNVVALWSKVLDAVPQSRLVLKCSDLEQPDLRETILEAFVGHGIEKDRIELREKSPHFELLQTYNEIDIALDPFPYSGGLTTLESLWMGVPVITKTGNTFAGRHSTSHLHAIGLSDWVCRDDNAYVSLARLKASDLSSLSTLRLSLRDRMRQSPICDAKSFTLALEQAFIDMYAKAFQPLD